MPAANTNMNMPPPFLTKTYDMLEDEKLNNIIQWTDNG